MTRDTLFWNLLVTAILGINGVLNIAKREYAIAALMFAIPTAGWLALFFGK